jgi:lipid-A-disaccharide synthase
LSSLPDFPKASGSVDLLVVAGEASGDEHAAQVVLDLKARQPNLTIYSLGGEKLRQAGAEQLFPLADHGVVGLFEVLKNYSFFRDIFEKTISWIEHAKPCCILLVDYPGFNLRLADALRKRAISCKGGGEVSVLQYISPQLWAWKPKRRFAMAKVLDGLGVIFPFETNCYEDVSLPVSFVGHPFAHPSYRSPVKYDPQGELLLLPGSRAQPVSRILPVFLDALETLNAGDQEVRAVLPASTPQIREQVERMVSLRSRIKNCLRVVNRTDGLAARAALMSSGTMSLSCAWAGIPGVIGYRAHPFTYLIGKLLVRVPHLGMANLLLPDNPPNPEFLQGRATGMRLAEEIRKIFLDQESGKKASHSAQKLHQLLAQPEQLGVVDWLIQEGKLG